MKTRVLLADDHQMLREGLRGLLANDPDLEVMGEAETGREAVELVRAMAPEVVVMDIAMPDLNGVEATRQIREFAPHTRVVALSMHGDQRFVTEMFRAGAAGYVLKDAAFDELSRAVHAVAEGHMYLSPAIAGTIIGVSLPPEAATTSVAMVTLTARQREVLQLVAEGLSTKEVAHRLHVTVKTVETHRSQIMKRLSVFSVAELTKYAIREGITSLER